MAYPVTLALPCTAGYSHCVALRADIVMTYLAREARLRLQWIRKRGTAGCQPRAFGDRFMVDDCARGHLPSPATPARSAGQRFASRSGTCNAV
jgi:hypothetical protein